MKLRGYLLLFVCLAFGGALFSQAQKDRGQKKPVDIKADYANRYPEYKEALILTGDVAFHHNGTVITCDSAVRYSDSRIDCFRNVIINKDSTYVYGDRAEYNGDLNMARVYSPVVKVIDGTATLYTYNFSFNTLDNIGIYYGGGVMYQDDNILESEKGYYYSDLRELVAIRNVEMKNDNYSIISDSVRYNMETKVAHFYSKTYIWTDEGEIITADKGRYNTQDSTYFFYGNAYVLTDFRETWADTIDFNAKRNDALLYGNVQIDDNENQSSAFGDFGQYWGKKGETMLTRRPSLLNYNEDQGNSDTLYMRADTIFMFVIYPSEKPAKVKEADPHAHLKWVDDLPDSVRWSMADSLRPVISRLRSEADSLRHIADSIMNALYPEAVPENIPLPVNGGPPTGNGSGDLPAVTESNAGNEPEGGQEGSEIGEEEAGAREEEQSGDLQEEPSRRRKDRRRGPYPELWMPPYADTLSSGTPGTDSLAAAHIPPTGMVTDSLSHMEKIKELLPTELSGEEASTLLHMFDEGIPEGMSHLASDSIDVAALKNVIEEAALTAPEAAVLQPEPAPEPEKPEPDEVKILRMRVAELTAEADSLQTAETYIRPKSLPPAPASTVDSAALAAAADSIARLDDLLHPDRDGLNKKALKKLEKAEKKRIKAEQKAARKAEKKRLREEKRAAKAAARAEKEAERRRRAIAKRGWITETPMSDSLAMLDSLRRADSLMQLQLDSLERLSQPPKEEKVSEPDTTERIFRGWYDVKIWRKDMQAVCDSIVGFSSDSTIHMYTNPILWQGESQIVADSIIMHTANEQMDYAEFFGNPIMSSKIADKQFNQLTGRTMKSWFRDNEVYRHDADGNAQAYYYFQEEDDPRPAAFLVVSASNITFFMQEQYVEFIVARQQIEWPLYPIDQIPTGQPVYLKGFKWHEDRKPALEDVFDRRVRPAEREFHESLELPKFPIAARINRRREYLIENRMWADRVDLLPAHAVEYVRSLQE